MNEQHKKFLMEGAARATGLSLATSGKIFDGMNGGKTGQRAGSSLDFMEHRNYAPGDDPRLLDWNVYARTEKLTLKMFREEINPKLDLLFDGSHSMNLPESEKAAASFGILGLLATAAQNSQFTTRCQITGDELRPIINAEKPVQAWDGLEFDGTTGMFDVINSYPLQMRYHSIRFVVSDLLWAGSPEHFLKKISMHAAAVVIIQVLGQDDIEPPASGTVTLEDSETNQRERLFIDNTAIAKYKKTLARLQEEWEHACREVGASFITINAEELLETWDLSPFAAGGVLQL
jgi:uncharacterized protein (DUF58 family)